MKTTVNFCDFQDAFNVMDRGDNFSLDGKQALYDWIEQYEENTEEEIELDIIALCCEFTEYENLKELQDNYTDINSMEELQDHTTVIYIDDPPDDDEESENYDGSFIIQDY